MRSNDGKLRVASFFSGIGGFDLGFQRSGFKIVFQSEIDKYCNSILEKYWPDILRINDVCKIEYQNIPAADVWTGGFPCQDLSVARGAKGREGLSGENSGLFYPFFELIEKSSPKIVLIENVGGLLNSHLGLDFGIILNKFVQKGYAVAWRLFNSQFFGVPQSRPRVYLCAWKNDPNNAMGVLFEGSKAPKVAFSHKFKEIDIDPMGAVFVPKLSYCLAATSGRHTGTDWSRTYVSYRAKVRRLTPIESERIQGYPDGWTQFDFSDDGNKKGYDMDSIRYHMIGNAVSVPVIEWIAKKILDLDKESCDEKNKAFVLSKYPDFEEGKYCLLGSDELKSIVELDENYKGIKWGTGGIAYDNFIIHQNVSNSPLNPQIVSLINSIERGAIPEKYFLSSSAAIGILRRVNSQNRKLFPPLLKALTMLSKSEVVII